MRLCGLAGCDRVHEARNLCAMHYQRQRKGLLLDAPVNARNLLDDVPYVCVCEDPEPDGIGQCATCARLVVTYAHANRDRYREHYPDQWARAVDRRLWPPRLDPWGP